MIYSLPGHILRMPLKILEPTKELFCFQRNLRLSVFCVWRKKIDIYEFQTLYSPKSIILS